MHTRTGPEMKANDETASPSLLALAAANGRGYLEATTIHGFSYWVGAKRGFERVIWVAAVLAGFTGASYIVSSAIKDWLENPGTTEIKTFAKVCSIKLSEVP